MDYSRIQDSVDMEIIKKSHIVIVGAGGASSLITSLARTGIGKMTVIDYDLIEDSNITRQSFKISDIGKFKVTALEEEVTTINPEVKYIGINKSFLGMTDEELDTAFKDADLCLFLTDSFPAQSYGNIIALRYSKPALWSGWYAQSRTAELFFQVPEYSSACFRCACSSRYLANEETEVKISSSCNTIFHSMLLDSLIGMMSLAILHRNTNVPDTRAMNEYELFWNGMKDTNGNIPFNFFQFKAHPGGGNKLFDNAYSHLGMYAHNFMSCWQNADAELKINGYNYDCPDCKGKLHHAVNDPISNK